MGNGNYSSRVVVQVLFKPCNSFGIQMVCRLIQKQNVRLLQKQAAEGNSASLTTGKHVNNLIRRRTAQSVHSQLKIVIKIPCIKSVQLFLNLALAGSKLIKISIRVAVSLANLIKFFKKVCNFLYALFYNFHNSFSRLKIRLLFKIADCIAGCQSSLTRKILINARKNLKKRRFTRTIRSDYTDFCAVIVGNTHILKNNLSSVAAGNSVHSVDDFLIVKCFCHNSSIH